MRLTSKHQSTNDLFEAEEIQAGRVARVENAPGLIVALPSRSHHDGYFIPFHKHSRAQLLYAADGVAVVITHSGRWLIPSDHAMWIPAEVEHSVRMLGNVIMRSVYISVSALNGFPDYLHVVSMTDLMRSLIVDATSDDSVPEEGSRKALVVELILRDLDTLPQLPLGLPMPHDDRLDELCRDFLRHPSAVTTIDDWAEKMAMSRRSFTRHFQKETGVSLSVWRQQAILFAAMPRLAAGEHITTLALDLGYDSVSAFTTMFRRMLGVSPRFYQKSEQNHR